MCKKSDLMLKLMLVSFSMQMSSVPLVWVLVTLACLSSGSALYLLMSQLRQLNLSAWCQSYLAASRLVLTSVTEGQGGGGGGGGLWHGSGKEKNTGSQI